MDEITLDMNNLGFEEAGIHEENTEAVPSENTGAVSQETSPLFDIDGEKVPLETLKEWKNGYLRQSDYTQKTQTLAEQRKEHEQAVTAYNELLNWFSSNPQEAQRIHNLMTQPAGFTPAAQEETGYFDPQELAREIMGLKQYIGSWRSEYDNFMNTSRMEQGEKQAEQMLSQVREYAEKSGYPFDEKRFIENYLGLAKYDYQSGKVQGFPDPVEAYRFIFQKELEDKIRQSAVEEYKKKMGSALPSGKQNSEFRPTMHVNSDEQRREMALRELQSAMQ